MTLPSDTATIKCDGCDTPITPDDGCVSCGGITCCTQACLSQMRWREANR